MDENTPPKKAKWTTNAKGGRVLVDPDGYQYLISKKVKNTSYWYCRERAKQACKSIAVLKEDSEEIVSCTEHPHGRGLAKEHIRGIEEKLILAAATQPSVAPRVILGEITSTINSTASGSLGLMRSKSATTRAIQRKREEVRTVIFI